MIVGLHSDGVLLVRIQTEDLTWSAESCESRSVKNGMDKAVSDYDTIHVTMTKVESWAHEPAQILHWVGRVVAPLRLGKCSWSTELCYGALSSLSSRTQ